MNLEFDDLINTILGYCLIPSLILALIGVVIFLFQWNQFTRNLNSYSVKATIWGAIFFVQGFFFFSFVFNRQDTFETNTRKEVLMILEKEDILIMANHKLLESDSLKTIQTEIKRIYKPNYHHSHPTPGFELYLISGVDTIHLEFRQDSDIENEFWVYSEKYNSTKENEIGKLESEVFKSIIDSIYH